MYRALISVALLVSSTGSGCAYEFGSGDDLAGGSGGSGGIYVVAGNGVGSTNANANANASSGTAAATPLPDCGGFEDEFDDGSRWRASHTVFAGGLASTLGELMESEEPLIGGEIYTEGFFPVADCFLSLGIESAASKGLTIFAIENGASREDAFELQIGPRIQAAGDERGVQAVDYVDGDGTVLATYVRVDHPTHLGIWVDAVGGRMRGYVRTASGDWFSLGERVMPSYVQSTRFNAASLSNTQIPSEAKASFDDLNRIDVSAAELSAAKPYDP